ncbi:hypothetical protein D3C75_1338500 [compost metagenome]
MNITQASAKIAQALQAGIIDQATAVRAQAAIREKKYYGNTMKPNHRESILVNRFGII